MKYCIFCGNKPINKSKEHVIPKWLIELTGDPKRIINLGLDLPRMVKDTKLKPINEYLRKFAFDQFSFPACESCNSKYAVLEEQAQKIVLKLLNNIDLKASEISVLLDWLDKVRIGLWLGYGLLNKNPVNITPKFHISTRIQKSDRMVAIYRINDNIEGIQFLGADSLAFQFSPCCFLLVINNIAIFNMSTSYLFSRRLGLPYAAKLFFVYDNEIEWFTREIKIDIQNGSERIMLPLIRQQILRPCIELYQPIRSPIGKETIKRPNYMDEDIKKLYNTQYVKKFFVDVDLRIGKIFLLKGNRLEEIDYESDRISFKYDHKFQRRDLIKNLGIQTLKFQNLLIDWLITWDYMPKESANIIRNDFSNAKKINDKYIKYFFKRDNFML